MAAIGDGGRLAVEAEGERTESRGEDRSYRTVVVYLGVGAVEVKGAL
jgi:hypothetical protein